MALRRQQSQEEKEARDLEMILGAGSASEILRVIRNKPTKDEEDIEEMAGEDNHCEESGNRPGSLKEALVESQGPCLNLPQLEGWYYALYWTRVRAVWVKRHKIWSEPLALGRYADCPVSASHLYCHNGLVPISRLFA